MARVALVLLVIFLLLLFVRVVRFVLAALARGPRRRDLPVEGEMVRDPVCGLWIDRRLALAGRRGGEWLPVCSEKCRRELESA